MTDAPDPLPCPFCGNADVSPKSEWIAHPVEYMGHVECGDCDTIGPLSKYKYDNEDEAIADGIAVWNTRADLSRPVTVAEAAKLLLDADIERDLAKSMAHFLSVEEWEGYKRGVQAYTAAILAMIDKGDTA